MIVTAFEQHDWAPIGAAVFGWLLFIPIVYIGTRYQILWRDGALIQKASGMQDVLIRPNEITRIALETSDLQTLMSFRRPFRRIAIYARGADGSKWVDVSLKHFAADDIRKLMRAIHERRPDLSMPKNWT
jgi:hypothetical protein